MSSQAIVIMVLSEVAQFLVVDKALEKITGRRANKEKTKMTNVTFESIRNAMKTNQGVNKAKVVQEKVVEATKKTVGAISGVMPVTNNKMDNRTEDILRLLAATQLEVQDLKRQLNVQTKVDYNEVEDLASTYLKFMKNGEEEKAEKVEEQAEQAVDTALVEGLEKYAGIKVSEEVKTDPRIVIKAAPRADVASPVEESVKEVGIVQEAITGNPVPSENPSPIVPVQTAQSAPPTPAETITPLTIKFDQPSDWHMGPQI